LRRTSVETAEGATGGAWSIVLMGNVTPWSRI
jgi:hypothetical protein